MVTLKDPGIPAIGRTLQQRYNFAEALSQLAGLMQHLGEYLKQPAEYME